MTYTPRNLKLTGMSSNSSTNKFYSLSQVRFLAIAHTHLWRGACAMQGPQGVLPFKEGCDNYTIGSTVSDAIVHSWVGRLQLAVAHWLLQ